MRIIKIAFGIVALAASPAFAQVDLRSGDDPIVAKYQNGNVAEARNAWELLAWSGNYDAQVTLGLLYSGLIDPKGLELDYGEALVWMNVAAAQQETAIERRLDLVLVAAANELLTEDSPQYDPPMGVEWLNLAASLGNAYAGESLGSIYETGRGAVPRDDRAAIEWYEWAATASLTSLFNAVRVHLDSGRVGSALYWLDHAYLTELQGVENTPYGYDNLVDAIGYDLAATLDAYRRLAYTALIPNCGADWQLDGVNVTVFPDDARTLPDSMVGHPVLVSVNCRHSRDDSEMRVTMALNQPDAVAQWNEALNEVHGSRGELRDTLTSRGFRLGTIDNNLAAVSPPNDSSSGTYGATVLGGSVVMMCETQVSSGKQTVDADRAMACLESLDTEAIVAATDGVATFVYNGPGDAARQ